MHQIRSESFSVGRTRVSDLKTREIQNLRSWEPKKKPKQIRSPPTPSSKRILTASFFIVSFKPGVGGFSFSPKDRHQAHRFFWQSFGNHTAQAAKSDFWSCGEPPFSRAAGDAKPKLDRAIHPSEVPATPGRTPRGKSRQKGRFPPARQRQILRHARSGRTRLHPPGLWKSRGAG